MEFCTLTGEMEKGLVGCKIEGRNFFARPVFGTAFQSVPSEKWLQKYHKQFFGVIAYENLKGGDSYDRPLLMGVVPVNHGDYDKEAIENKHKVRTEKFEAVFDDLDDSFTLKHADGMQIFFNKDKVVLAHDGAYKAVLGDKLVDLLKDLTDLLKSAKVNTSIGPQPFMPGTQLKLAQLKAKWETILSNLVKLD